MNEHRLKSWPEYFNQVRQGQKTFELRVNDRDFQVGDRLILQEFDPMSEQYSGQELQRTVTYILFHEENTGSAADVGLAPGYVIMSLR